jgi:hypothetical protein
MADPPTGWTEPKSLFWNNWLPDDVKKGVEEVEPRKFRSLVAAYHAKVAEARASSEPNRFHYTMAWVPLINT